MVKVNARLLCPKVWKGKNKRHLSVRRERTPARPLTLLEYFSEPAGLKIPPLTKKFRQGGPALTLQTVMISSSKLVPETDRMFYVSSSCSSHAPISKYPYQNFPKFSH